jgi:hypothetical protein
MSERVFCVQDRTGTAAQLTLDADVVETVEVGDTGVYHGLSWNGVAQALNFTVGQVHDPLNFGITTMTPTGAAGNILQSGWPKSGTVTWLTGGNVDLSPNQSEVIAMNPANSYCSVDAFETYHSSRGNVFPASPVDAIETAIVQSTDYIDQRYRFKGIKLFQFLTDNPQFDPVIGFIDPWLADFGFLGGAPGFLGAGPGMNFDAFFAPSYTAQHTEWPRQGVVDYNGDSVFGVPRIVQWATAELALRVLTGAVLQPDYDPNVVTAGGVLQSITEHVGPISVSKTYDTKLGLSFFPSFPHIERMLRNAGLLVGGGGRTLTR